MNPTDLLIHTGKQSFDIFMLTSRVSQLTAENADLTAKLAEADAALKRAQTTPTVAPPVAGEFPSL